MKHTEKADTGNQFVGGPLSSNIPKTEPVTLDIQNDVFGPPQESNYFSQENIGGLTDDEFLLALQEANKKKQQPVLGTRMPKLGETVIFFPNPDDSVSRSNGATCIPAIITRPWSSVCSNIKVIPDHGPMQDRGSVSHWSANPAGYHFMFQDEYELMEQELGKSWEKISGRLYGYK